MAWLVISRKRTDHFLAGLLAIHETFRNDIWRQQLITLFELLEQNAIGEALTTNTNTFQDAIASQLIKHQRRIQLASLKQKKTLKYSYENLSH